MTEWILEEGWKIKKGKRDEYLDGMNGRVITGLESREWMDIARRGSKLKWEKAKDEGEG